MSFVPMVAQKADKHYTPVQQEKCLPGRMSQLLDISMSNEQVILIVCRGCSDKFISVEKHLAQLKERALSSYKTFNRKRAANSVTPTTEQQCPPGKRNPPMFLYRAEYVVIFKFFPLMK